MSELVTRAREIAEFLGIPEADAIAKLSMGFGPLHNAVSEDWRRVNPQTDAEIIEWYRTTEAYIWELTAYHLDPGFNYSGMCEGIAVRLKNDGKPGVLCLGDGIGDLTISLKRHDPEFFDPFYHDLEGGRTSSFARHRIDKMNARRGPNILAVYPWMSIGPDFPSNGKGLFSAIVSLDFLEHVPNVEAWCRSIYGNMAPGGLFCAQNAFGCGSGPDGAMPMHLARNDRFVTDWDPLLSSIGFVQESSNWYRKPA